MDCVWRTGAENAGGRGEHMENKHVTHSKTTDGINASRDAQLQDAHMAAATGQTAP